MKALNVPGLIPKEYLRSEWAECTIPYRPWWKREWATYAERRDGQYVRTEHKTRLEIIAACEALDAKNPLPFPGLRVGQIWVINYLQLTIVIGPLTGEALIARFDRDVFERESEKVLTAASKLLPHTIPAESPGAIHSVMLLVDPCRPDLAPWTGDCPL